MIYCIRFCHNVIYSCPTLSFSFLSCEKKINAIYVGPFLPYFELCVYLCIFMVGHYIHVLTKRPFPTFNKLNMTSTLGSNDIKQHWVVNLPSSTILTVPILSIFAYMWYASNVMQLGTGSFGATANYTHRFSTKSHGRIAARIGRFIHVNNSSFVFWIVFDLLPLLC